MNTTMDNDLRMRIIDRIAFCERFNWSRNIGAGFIADDIDTVVATGDDVLIRFYRQNRSQQFAIRELNLRELDAVRAFLAPK